MRASPAAVRIGLIGYGFIGRQVAARLRSGAASGLELAFVHNRRRPDDLPAEIVLDDLARAAGRAPDLVVEMSHPDITRRFGAQLLVHADYLPLSVTALADDGVMAMLRASAEASGRRLWIPHGALMGTDNLVESRAMWEEVTITFIKNPAAIDFSASDFDVASIAGETVVYDGPVRGIAPLYPRNVNTMVTCALATVGLDRCRAVLIARPGIDHAIAEVRALGRDGSVLEMRKQQPMAGVSGTEMFESQWSSILRAANRVGSPAFV